jgi:hypothetical protein
MYVDPRKREFVFNNHVCIEMLMGVPDEKRTGRLVQVRRGVGAFGSDIFILRLRDGNLASFENALVRHVNDRRFEDAFYCSNGKNPPLIPEQSIDENDSTDVEYTIANKWPEKGFLVVQPNQPPSSKQSFAMMITTTKVATQTPVSRQN